MSDLVDLRDFVVLVGGDSDEIVQMKLLLDVFGWEVEHRQDLTNFTIRPARLLVVDNELVELDDLIRLMPIFGDPLVTIISTEKINESYISFGFFFLNRPLNLPMAEKIIEIASS